jgi:hypothetical protein
MCACSASFSSGEAEEVGYHNFEWTHKLTFSFLSLFRSLFTCKLQNNQAFCVLSFLEDHCWNFAHYFFMSKNGGNIGLFNIKLPISTLPKQWNAWALESYHVEVHTASDKQKMHNHVTEYALDKEKQIKMYQEPRKKMLLCLLWIFEKQTNQGKRKRALFVKHHTS